MGSDLATPIASDVGSAVQSECGVLRCSLEVDLLVKWLVYGNSSLESDPGWYQANLARVSSPVSFGKSWQFDNVWWVYAPFQSFYDSTLLGVQDGHVFSGGDSLRDYYSGNLYMHKIHKTSGAFVKTYGPYSTLGFAFFPRKWEWSAGYIGNLTNPDLEPDHYRFSCTMWFDSGWKFGICKWTASGSLIWRIQATYYYAINHMFPFVYKGTVYVVACGSSYTSLFLHTGDGELLWTVPYYLGPDMVESPMYCTVDLSNGLIWVAYTHGYPYDPSGVYSRLRSFSIADGSVQSTGEAVPSVYFTTVETANDIPLY